jgi:hypothetical protein
MGKTNKKSVEYCFNHTKERMYERHKLGLTRKEYDDLCVEYLEPHINIIGAEKNQRIFETEFKGKIFRFVWCTKRKTITTVFF